MHRRKFLLLSLAAAASPATAQEPFRLKIALKPGLSGNAIAPDFTGLSYESAVLSDPTFFAPANAGLIGLFRNLGTTGVLRIGGNTSEYAVWTRDGGDYSETLDPHGPDLGEAAPKKRPVTPLAIQNLRAFADATGWPVIYGLNLGTAAPDTVADEAAYVAQTLGPKLVGFQLGNEPDLFSHNGLRTGTYDFADYAAEWRLFANAVCARVPDARFGGPDAAGNHAWPENFAWQFRDALKFLSHHYYAGGPPSNPSVTVENLLTWIGPQTDWLGQMIARMRAIAPALPFRLTEMNSCYGGGKPGVSNTFASALWGAEAMYLLAAAGASGVNFHGGGYGVYSPIVGTRVTGFSARPLYYGMLMFAAAGPGRLVPAEMEGKAPSVSVYGLKSADGSMKAALFNKSESSDAIVTLDPGTGAQIARLSHLTAPALASTGDVTFAGAAVGSDGAWTPAAPEIVRSNDGAFTFTLPGPGAVLCTFAA